MEEIKRKSKKDNMEDQRLRRQMDNEKEIYLKKINIFYLHPIFSYSNVSKIIKHFS